MKLPFSLDAASHIILSDLTGNGVFSYEMPFGLGAEKLAEEILRGQHDSIVEIVEWNAVEGYSRVVTEDILRAVAKLSFAREVQPYSDLQNLLNSFEIASYIDPVEAAEGAFYRAADEARDRQRGA